jgi:hypothetical protein
MGLATLAACVSACAAPLPTAWLHEQHFEVPSPGLVKLSLPAETLDAARTGLEDLRLYDDDGNEIPYLLERPRPTGAKDQRVKSFQVSLEPAATVISIETGIEPPADMVLLDTAEPLFIKSVKVEASEDGNRWQVLKQGQPIFRQPGGVSQLEIPLPAGSWNWLRLSLDDTRSPPIPVIGARVRRRAAEPPPVEQVSAQISERHENPGETRITVDLGAANLDLSTLELATDEPLFTRRITLAVAQMTPEGIREQTLAEAVVYRMAIPGQTPSSNLVVSVEKQVPARELVLLIHNQDSPPLPVRGLKVERRPVYMVFLGRSGAQHHLLTGNPLCEAPRYDLASLGPNLTGLPVTAIQLSRLADNPCYRAPEVLTGIQEGSTALDVSDWKYRKAVRVERPGAQQLELDPEVLAHATGGYDDLRLVRAGKQVPFIIERTSLSRALAPTVNPVADPKEPKLSRWLVKLTLAGVPISRLSCTARTPLFERQMSIYEEVADERGTKYRRPLGTATWVSTPHRAGRDFVVGLDSPPRSDTLYLETDNGDNPPVDFEKFRVFYAATRLVFKAQGEGEFFLYYGNPRVGPPRYDLSLVAGQLLAAAKSTAGLEAEQQLKGPSWRESHAAGKGGVVFWGILALVVVVLFAIIARLLPKAPATGS